MERINTTNYVITNTGEKYVYNYKIGKIYFCDNNVIVDNGNLILDYHLETSKYIVLDNFIFDLKEKSICQYKSKYSKSTNDELEKDSFIDGLKNISKISVRTNKDKSKVITIKCEGAYSIVIKIDAYGRIIKYKNENITEIGNNFLYLNDTIQEIDIPNVINIGNKFLENNNTLKELFIESAEH